MWSPSQRKVNARPGFHSQRHALINTYCMPFFMTIVDDFRISYFGRMVEIIVHERVQWELNCQLIGKKKGDSAVDNKAVSTFIGSSLSGEHNTCTRYICYWVYSYRNVYLGTFNGSRGARGNTESSLYICTHPRRPLILSQREGVAVNIRTARGYFSTLNLPHRGSSDQLSSSPSPSSRSLHFLFTGIIYALDHRRRLI